MIRVVKGNPDDAELAAVTVVLFAVAATGCAHGTDAAAPAGWRSPQWMTHPTGPWRKPGHTVLSWRRHRKG
jgi:acyl-CoA carboxylase epsilon subunit-like protein